MRNRLVALGALTLLSSPSLAVTPPSELALAVAERALAEHEDDVLSTLADLVAIPTVGREEGSNADLPAFVAFRARLAEVAASLGFDFSDHGDVVVIGLGSSGDRLGLVTHGDVKPADASQWARDPFELDTTSEPGKLIGRGVEDDKGAIAVGLWAMKALAEAGRPLTRRIELIVALTEESDWNPLRDFLAAHPPPPLNIVFDSDYPVTVAEKGWGDMNLRFPLWEDGEGLEEPWLTDLAAGSFLSQVPDRASVRVARGTLEMAETLKQAAETHGGGKVEVRWIDDELMVIATGTAVHSSIPEEGDNALVRLAAVLGALEWPPSAAAGAIRLIEDLVGPGDYAERFGDLAYRDALMGPLTLTAARVRERAEKWDLELGISLRRPSGRSREDVFGSMLGALGDWLDRQPEGYGFAEIEAGVSNPIDHREAPQVPVLLGVYRHFTGDADAQPVAIGGSTNAKLVPDSVSFGPAWPGRPYTGHSEHEFTTPEVIRLNLQMMAAALAELALEP